MAQLTYNDFFDLGFEGQLADGSPDRFIQSKVNAAASMEFGRAVVQGATDKEVALPSAGTGETFAGVTVHTHATERFLQGPSGGPFVGIPQNQPANVLTKGRVVVVPETAVTPADPVYYRWQGAGADPEALARFRADADSGDALLVASARWVTSAAAGEKAILELNLP